MAMARTHHAHAHYGDVTHGACLQLPQHAHARHGHDMRNGHDVHHAGRPLKLKKSQVNSRCLIILRPMVIILRMDRRPAMNLHGLGDLQYAN